MKKHMSFFVREEFSFYCRMKFMCSGLENLVKTLPEDKVKYLPQQFGEKQLGLVISI